MRRSEFKTEIGQMRKTLGVTQSEMGKLLSCSARTIQAIELGKLPISDKMRIKMELLSSGGSVFRAAIKAMIDKRVEAYRQRLIQQFYPTPDNK